MNSAGVRILVVEDDPATGELERRAIRRKGWEAVIHAALEDALSAIQDTSYTAIVLDLNLGATAAWPVLEAGAAASPPIPVIIVTAMGDERVASKAIGRGAFDYVIKGGDFLERLTLSLERAIRLTAAERELQQLKSWQSAILESVDAHIALLDDRGTIVMVNESWIRFAQDNGLGDPRYGVGMNYFQVMENARGADSEFARKVSRALRDIIDGTQTRFSMEYPCHTATDRRWFRVDLSPVRSEHVRGAVVMHVDISSRVLADEERLEHADLLHNILQSVDEGILVVNAAGKLQTWNRSALAILGLTARDLIDDWDKRLAPVPNQRQLSHSASFPLLRALKGSIVSEEEVLVRPEGGRRAYLSVNARPLPDKLGDIRGAVATFRDITERIARETEMRRIAAAIQQTADAIIITDTRGKVEYINPAFQKMYGYTAEEIYGRSTSLLKSSKQDPAIYTQLWTTLLAGETWSGRFLNSTKSGELRIADCTITPVRDLAGHNQFYVAAQRDVTAHVALETHLRESQKLEAIGVLAGGIAHDFNNILASIVGYTQLAGTNLNPASESARDLDRVLKATARAQDLIRQILTFSRENEAEMRPLDPAGVLAETVEMMRAVLPATVGIKNHAEFDRWQIRGDESQLQQVFVNLCTNAAHAMRARGGTLALSLDEITLQAGALESLETGLPDGDYVRIMVSDTGSGIPKELVARIFDPFFSTKKDQGGTGLGLSTARGIVMEHGGNVRVESEIGRGSDFFVYLPISKARKTDVPAPPKTEKPRGNGEHILVIDDEESLTIMSERILKSLGYQVTAFNDPELALADLRSAQTSYDLILSDLTMPKMTGIRLAEAIASLPLNVPIILLSGNATGAITATQNVDTVLTKPVRIDELAQAVRETIDRNAGKD